MAIFEKKEDIYRLMDKFEKSSISEIELELDDNVKIRMKKQIEYVPIQQNTAPVIRSENYINGEPLIINKQLPQKNQNLISENEPAPAIAPKAETKAIEPPKAADEKKIIKAPLIGVFYIAPSPESEPFVKVGSAIKKGTILCIIEAMKVMNEIESEIEGEIAEVLVESGAPVEYGQPLFKLK